MNEDHTNSIAHLNDYEPYKFISAVLYHLIESQSSARQMIGFTIFLLSKPDVNKDQALSALKRAEDRMIEIENIIKTMETYVEKHKPS